MSNTKEIKRRIKAAKNIGQITKAMQMVSAVKMKKSQARLKNSFPYFESITEIFHNLVIDLGEEAINDIYSKELKKNKKRNIYLIVISPSKGLAGGLFSNLTKKTIEFIEKSKKDTEYTNDEFVIFSNEEKTNEYSKNINIKLLTIEKKSKELVAHLEEEVIADFSSLHVPPTFEDILPLSSIIRNDYLKERTNEVYVVYTHFLNTFSQKAVIKRLFPFNMSQIKESKKDEKNQNWYTYSTNKIEFYKKFTSIYIDVMLYQTVLNAVASEHSARMIAMKNATDNAKELKKELTLEYNQKRQASITQEIAEITSASEV